MLTDEQIDYLLQIKETKPLLPERTVRVMLGALRWSPEEINHGVNFLNRPEEKSKEKRPEQKIESARAASPAPAAVPPPTSLEPKPAKPVIIKQNPFPLGSPLFKNANHHAALRKQKRRPLLWGALAGLVLFCAGIIIYARVAGVGR